ncbi:hypothetical protein N9792_09410, partial [Planktomarina temperata]|nr:hypothetical protein [Planktomarina temperata]
TATDFSHIQQPHITGFNTCCFKLLFSDFQSEDFLSRGNCAVSTFSSKALFRQHEFPCCLQLTGKLTGIFLFLGSGNV